MNEVWVLTVKTSLPGVCESKADLKLSVFTYNSFENAKQALRKKLKELSFASNEMFDGNGGIKELVKYSKNSVEEPYEEDDEEVLSTSVTDSVNEILLKIFSGKDTSLKKIPEYCTDWSIAIEKKKDALLIHGTDDGPYNGYDPFIYTNMASMTEEKNYFLYIDDYFGQEASSELYIDLVKSEIV
ncbi:MAG: hypothetical protein IJ400_05760 [Clostridia bacterium]|nr:hypothetical protein [Clostridia bacterium]